MNTHIRHYRLLEKIPSGGMGVVYKAEDTLLKRIVALKFLPEDAVADETSKRRFLREAQAASALDHPNICSIHSIEETEDGRPFIDMSWCEGSTLRELLASRRLGIEEALDIVLQVARGLEGAHQFHIVHRDIKPGNIMVSPAGQAKILDFGIARITDATRITKSGAAFGTVLYMSPEQIADEPADCRSDVWSLGAVLYETVTGNPPFTGNYEAAILYSIMNDDYEPASRRNTAVPEALDAVLRKALKKKPDERYATIGDLIYDLETIRSERLAKPSANLEAGAGRPFLSRRSRLALAAGVAVVIAAAVLIGRHLSMTPRGKARAAVVEFSIPQTDPSGAPSLGRLVARRLAESKVVLMPDRDLEHVLDRIDDFAGATAFSQREGFQFIIALRNTEGAGVSYASANVYDTTVRKWIISEHAEGAAGAGGASALADTLSAAVLERLHEYPGTDPDWNYNRSLENYLAGEERYLAGDPEASMPYFNKSLEYDSSFVETLLRLAVWEFYARDVHRAQALAARARALSAGNACLAARVSIVELRAQGKLADAAEEMRKYLKLVPDDASMHLDLGYVLYHDMGSPAEAIPYLLAALAIDSTDFEDRAAKTYDCLANASVDLGQYNEAESYLRKYLDLMPGNANALHSLASVYRVSGRYDLAIGQYEKVSMLDPTFFPTYDELCLSYLALGRLRDALLEIKSYYPYAQRSLHANALLLEGRIYLLQGEYEKAAQAADSAFAIDSLRLNTYWLRGRIALAQGDISSARDNLRSMLALRERANDRRDSAFVHNLAGWINMAEGNAAMGLEELERSAAGPIVPLMYFRRDLIRACLETGNAREAERLALEALAFNDNDAEVLYLLGSAYHLMGNRAKARKYFERAKVVWAGADEKYELYRDLISKLNDLKTG